MGVGAANRAARGKCIWKYGQLLGEYCVQYTHVGICTHTHLHTHAHAHTHTLAHTLSPPLVFRNILFRNEVLKSGTSCLELCGEMCLNFKETRPTCS